MLVQYIAFWQVCQTKMRIGNFVDFLIYQIAKGIIGVSSLCLSDITGRHPVQVIVGVDMGSLLCLIGAGITLILGSWIVRFLRLVRIVVLIRFFLVSTVKARRCILDSRVNMTRLAPLSRELHIFQPAC